MQARIPRRPIWLDGAMVPPEDATVSVMAHAMQRGSLVFDVGTFHDTARGVALFRLREHVARLLRSASIVGLALPFDHDALETAAREAVRASGLRAGLLRWSAYFPSFEGDLVPREAAASVAVAAYAADDTLPEGAMPKARPARMRVAVYDDARKAAPDAIPPLAKVAAAYLGPMLARRRALLAGFHEVVLLDAAGSIAEAPTCNVFAVVQGALVTPPLGAILDGITRDSVMEIARAAGLEVREAHIAPSALASADEVFLTASSLPIAEVGHVNDVAIRGGEITRGLAARLAAIQEGRDATFARWLAPA